MKWITILFFLLSCTHQQWVDTPLYPGSLYAVMAASKKVLEQYSSKVSFDKDARLFESDWYNPDRTAPKGFARRAKIYVRILTDNSPFTITSRVFYEQSAIGKNTAQDGKNWKYEGELPRHARQVLRQVIRQAEEIDGKMHSLDQLKVF